MAVNRLIAGLMVALASLATAGQPVRYPVTIEATADKPDKDGYRAVRVTLHIDEGHRVSANPVGNEYLAGDETTLKVVSDKRLHEVKVIYPRGEIVKNIFSDFMVYRDTIVLQALVKQAQGDMGPLEVRVGVRPRNDSHCFPPKTLKLIVR